MAASAEVNQLQRIHLARAALHLVVSADEILGTELSDEEFTYIMELEADRSEEEPSVFTLLCDDRQGALDVRRSYKVYQMFCQMDDKDIGIDVTSSMRAQRLAPHDPALQALIVGILDDVKRNNFGLDKMGVLDRFNVGSGALICGLYEGRNEACLIECTRRERFKDHINEHLDIFPYVCELDKCGWYVQSFSS
ncbi:hypothetical protein FRC17_007967 [Serendipita sp. 399]|nr:hypothetical protein FRC17_007967 [Serendipita sp. 399]